MNLRKKRWMVTGAALAMVASLGLSACGGSSSSGGGQATNSETGKNEVTMASRTPNWIFPISAKGYTQGENGQFIQAMYRPLFAYKSTSETPYKINLPKSLGTVPEVSEDGLTYTIKLRDDAKWSDGTPVTTRDIEFWWNLVTNNKDEWASYKKGFFPDGADLKIIDEHTFSITTETKFAPAWFIDNQINKVALLPQHAWDKTSADETVSDLDRTPEGAQKVFAYLQGEAKNLSSYATNPLWQTVNGPWKLAEFTPDQGLKLVPNENYVGDEKPQNDGVTFVFYNSMDAAYNDLKAGNVDVLDAVPSSAMASYQQTFAGTSVNEPYAGIMTLTIPQYLDHFKGEEGKLRRQAISMAINRDEITSTIYAGARTPAKDFTAPTLPGYSNSLPGSDVLTYNETKAKELWAQADAIAPWDGTFEIAYNSDGGHKEWVDAAANSIKNTLNIDAQGKAIVDFKTLLQQEDDQTIGAAFRSGWQGDYPSIYNFLQPLYVTKAASNKGDYSNPEFDALITKAAGAANADEATTAMQQAQEILLQDLPVIPLWYYNVNGAWSKNVSNVTFDWRGQPMLSEITKNASK